MRPRMTLTPPVASSRRKKKERKISFVGVVKSGLQTIDLHLNILYHYKIVIDGKEVQVLLIKTC
jgi:hypothetical protein